MDGDDGDGDASRNSMMMTKKKRRRTIEMNSYMAMWMRLAVKIAIK